MADPDPHLLSAITTEHFVLQSAINATVLVLIALLAAFYAFERWRFERSKPVLRAVSAVNATR